MSGRGSSDVAVAVTAVAGVIAVSIVASILWANVIYDLWRWFAVPLGAPMLALPHVWGLMMLKGMIFYRMPRKDEEPQWSVMLTYPLVAWALGAIAAWWLA